jgi:NAD(P)-dependent dehydrogenase (short-subunit alcohol dehydrogenase family)
MFSLEGKTVVITGGGRGIGRGIARACAIAGANVAITGRSADALEDTRSELEERGAQCLPIPGDLMSHEGIAEIVARTTERFGAIQGWVNNAGSAAPGDVGPLLDLSEDQWDRVVDLNLKWTFFAMQAAAKAMQDTGGSIVNISSRSGSQPCPMTGQYGAAKAGLDSLTATAAVEWGYLGIRVNGIAPGVVLTESTSSMDNPSRRKRQIQTVPLQRLGVVDDVGPLAVYFLADESAWTSGSVVPVTGGSRIPVGVLTYLHHRNKDIEPA